MMMKSVIALFALVALAVAADVEYDIANGAKYPESAQLVRGWYDENGDEISACRGVVYNNVAQMCCNGVIVDQSYTSITVDGTTAVVPSTKCCGVSTTAISISYNKTALNGGNAIELGLCCGDSYVTQDDDKTCCGGSYVDVKDNHDCCEGQYADNAFSGGLCCGGAWTNNTDGLLACCGQTYTVSNNGFKVGDNTGYSSSGYSAGFPIAVSKAATYKKFSEWCCKGKIQSKLDDNTAFFNDTDVQKFTCCGGFSSYNPKIQETCGNDELSGSTCEIYSKSALKVCKDSDWTCPVSHSGSYSVFDCGAKIGKGASGFTAVGDINYNSAGSATYGASGASTAVFSVAALVAAAAFLF